MAQNPEHAVTAWLRDAYAMEKASIEALEHQVKHADHIPQLKSRLQGHLDETRRHADLVKECIEARGESTSTLKNMHGKLIGMIQGSGPGAAPDSLVKDTLASIGAEHFEIASYKALVDGARRIGDTKTADVCERILREEEAQARFLESQLTPVVDEHLRSLTAAA